MFDLLKNVVDIWSKVAFNLTLSNRCCKEWDLEASLPKSAQLNIICTDAGGLTSSKLIAMSVAPINEIDPVIVPTSMMVAVSQMPLDL